MSARDAVSFAPQAPPIRPGSVRAWILACRPVTLTAALAPILVGTAVAGRFGAVRVGAAAAALLGAMLIQIATNFANDVFDHEKGADTAERLGPTRATQSGLLTPREVRVGMAVTVALAVATGLYLTAIAGWPVVAIGVISIASGIAYTAGPYPLGYHGLGDLFVFLFFGFVAVLGTVFVEIGAVPALAIVAALPVGAVATAVLVVNNVRDRATDVVAGKRTLAVRFGRSAGLAEYACLLVMAYAAPIAIAAATRSAWAALPLVSAPLALRLWSVLRREEGKALNPVLAGTAKLLLAHSALFATGLSLAGRVG